MKLCLVCNIEKELSEFPKSMASPDRRSDCCRLCHISLKEKGMKFCSPCKSPKSLDDFGPSKRDKSGKRPTCNDCRKLKEKSNPKYKHQWYAEDKVANPEKYKKNSKIQNDKRKEQKKEWYLKNYVPKKKSEITADIRRICRVILASTLDRAKQNRPPGTSAELMGYLPADFKEHIEKLWTTGMNWENHGEWHIDHIIPICQFPKGTPISIMNSLPNLRPLWKTTRVIDGVEYIGNLNRKCKDDIAVEPTANMTLFLDIDGTLVKHYMAENGEGAKDQTFRPVCILDGVAKKFDEWKSLGYYIVLTTARKEENREGTENQLRSIGIWWDQLIMGLPSGRRYVINDMKFNSYNPTAVGINLKRNSGLENIDLELAVKFQTLAMFYGVALEIIM